MSESKPQEKETAQALVFPRAHKPLYLEVEGTLLSALLRKEAPKEREAPSGLGTMPGTRLHPFDMDAVIDFDDQNEYHSTCIHTKVNATVGLGFVSEKEKIERKRKKEVELGLAVETPLSAPEKSIAKVDEFLNPLCRYSWQDTILSMAQDLHQVGNGYLEVVRNSAGKVTGIHHVPAPQVHIFVEDRRGTIHFEITDPESASGVQRFAHFGDSEFLNRVGTNSYFNLPKREDGDTTSEIIHFRLPSSKNRWYGYPQWLSAVATIELMQMTMQHYFDFYLNRGVPEFLLCFQGISLSKEQWKIINDSLQGHVGLGNAFKSLVLQLPNVSEQSKVVFEKMGESGETIDKLASSRESLSLGIVTAHRTPPLLAGIQIPGKLGAVNELPNALMSFQILCIGGIQRIIYQTLVATLGHPDLGVKGLKPEDFELKQITDEIDVGNMDTVARMRQSPMQAKNEGRNLADGVKS